MKAFALTPETICAFSPLLPGEFQQQFAAEQGLESYAQCDPSQQIKTKKGRALSKKLDGLNQLTEQIRAQGTVVAADMLSSQMLTEYKQTYGLSKKELERLVGDLQQGSRSASSAPLQEHASLENKTRSSLLKKPQPGREFEFQPLYLQAHQALSNAALPLSLWVFQYPRLLHG